MTTRTEIRLRAGTRHLVVELDAPLEGRRTCRVEGRVFTVETLYASSGRVVILVDGRPVEALVRNTGDTLAVAVGGGATHRFTLARPGEAASARPRTSLSGRITAPMPGRVLNVLVAPGDHVAHGQAVVLLEAMKMEHTLRAEADGEVTAVLVRPGDMVDGAELLLEIAPAVGSGS
jgi:3-methylcrotonyl-CoA carboxylase alpha subunit